MQIPSTSKIINRNLHYVYVIHNVLRYIVGQAMKPTRTTETDCQLFKLGRNGYSFLSKLRVTLCDCSLPIPVLHTRPGQPVLAWNVYILVNPKFYRKGIHKYKHLWNRQDVSFRVVCSLVFRPPILSSEPCSQGASQFISLG